jgi:hypothetical protein
MYDQPNQSALELRLKQIVKYLYIGLGCLIVVGLLSGVSFWKVSQEREVAVQNQQVQAETTKQSSWCTIYPDDQVCQMAREITSNPTTTLIPKDGLDGRNGNDGQNGRGVTTFDVSDGGNLIVNYTDGTSEDIGHIIGKNGLDGINGKDGKDGKGILSVTIDKGNLIIGFSDGVTTNLGMVVGPAGQDGSNGTNGVDGEAGAAGATGPAGPTGAAGKDGAPGTAGKDGISVTDLQVDAQGFVNVSYSDGTTRSAGQIIVNTVRSISCEGSTFTMTMVDGKTLSTTVDCTPDSSPIPPSNPKSLL